jgi:hypothetical protein
MKWLGQILALAVCLVLLSPVVEARPFYKTKKFWAAVAATATVAVTVVATKGYGASTVRHFNPEPRPIPAPPIQQQPTQQIEVSWVRSN